MHLRKIFRLTIYFIRTHYVISFFIVVVLFVVFTVFVTFLSVDKEFIYAKVKVSQGLWWANTNKPDIWLTKAIKKGDIEVDLSGKPKAEIIEAHRYPWYASNQYNTYIYVKLLARKNKKTEKYIYNRSQIAVGSPIDFEFPNVQFSGTVMEISDKPIQYTYKEIEVTLQKEFADKWEINAVHVGDTMFDGEDIVLEIIGKNAKEIPNYFYTDNRRNISFYLEKKYVLNIQVKIKVLTRGKSYVFGQDQNIVLGNTLLASTDRYLLNNYKIVDIKDKMGK